MTIRETANLRLECDGTVFLSLPEDEYGERDGACLGDIWSCERRVPPQYRQEFEELEEAWEDACRESSDYRAGVGHDFDSTRGCR